tara:strand:+ start:452 stop:1144 length:693 start_codon:yes stop_codon:yes gene_type:complete
MKNTYKLILLIALCLLIGCADETDSPTLSKDKSISTCASPLSVNPLEYHGIYEVVDFDSTHDFIKALSINIYHGEVDLIARRNQGATFYGADFQGFEYGWEIGNSQFLLNSCDELKFNEKNHYYRLKKTGEPEIVIDSTFETEFVWHSGVPKVAENNSWIITDSMVKKNSLIIRPIPGTFVVTAEGRICYFEVGQFVNNKYSSSGRYDVDLLTLEVQFTDFTSSKISTYR